MNTLGTKKERGWERRRRKGKGNKKIKLKLHYFDKKLKGRFNPHQVLHVGVLNFSDQQEILHPYSRYSNRKPEGVNTYKIEQPKASIQ